MAATSRRDELVLKALLYLVGAICLTALLPTLMPVEWMAWAHEKLGLGAFPEQPIAEYLARGMSGVHAFYGGLLVLLARDVRRYAVLITYQAIVMPVGGTILTILAIRAGIPASLVGGDIVIVWLYAIPMLVLVRRVVRAGTES